MYFESYWTLANELLSFINTVYINIYETELFDHKITQFVYNRNS